MSGPDIDLQALARLVADALREDLRVPDVFDTKGAAHYLKLATQTLEQFRTSGGGPAYIKLNRAVRYRREDLDRWLAERVRANTSRATS